jgi:hypothetical protein
MELAHGFRLSSFVQHGSAAIVLCIISGTAF